MDAVLAIPQSVMAGVAARARAKWRWVGRVRFIDVEDIAQEALLRLWKTYYRHGQEPTAPQATLAVKRTAIDLLTVSRHATTGRNMVFPEVSVEDGFREVLEQQTDPGPTPEYRAMVSEQVAHIARWYATLGGRDQHIVRELAAGRCARHIADDLGLTEGRVSQIVKTFRQQLTTME